MFGAAGVFAAFGFGCVTACFVAALQLGISVWLAALIVALVYFAIAAVLALMGRSQINKATPPLPAEAVEKHQGGCRMAQDPGEVRATIDQDRLELADTVQALAQKADVKQPSGRQSPGTRMDCNTRPTRWRPEFGA